MIICTIFKQLTMSGSWKIVSLWLFCRIQDKLDHVAITSGPNPETERLKPMIISPYTACPCVIEASMEIPCASSLRVRK